MRAPESCAVMVRLSAAPAVGVVVVGEIASAVAGPKMSMFAAGLAGWASLLVVTVNDVFT